MTSLRRTTLVGTTALLIVVGLLAFFIVYGIAEREAADFLDGQLRQIALNAGDQPALRDGTVAKLDAEDEFIIATWNAAGEPVRHPANGLGLPRRTEPGFASIRAGDEDWRVYFASDARRSVQVAQRMSVRKEMADAAAFQTGVPILLLIPLMWLVIDWALGRSLGRLEILARLIAGRGVDSRELIPVAGVPAEVLPLVAGMNVLTNRLQQALDRQKRFVADAAHELRTPLAALTIQLDNLAADAPTSQSRPITELRAGVSRTTTLVEQLLRLARSDGTPGAAPEAIDLAEVVTQCVADFAVIANAKSVDLGITACDRAMLTGWRAELKTLFDTLIDNAIRYTPAGGAVDVSVRNAGGCIAVEVLDSGCGVAEADIPRLFDRFFRAAPIDVDGNGLGLSIAAAIADRHGLAIHIENRSDRAGLSVRVSGSAGAWPDRL